MAGRCDGRSLPLPGPSQGRETMAKKNNTFSRKETEKIELQLDAVFHALHTAALKVPRRALSESGGQPRMWTTEQLAAAKEAITKIKTEADKLTKLLPGDKT